MGSCTPPAHSPCRWPGENDRRTPEHPLYRRRVVPALTILTDRTLGSVESILTQMLPEPARPTRTGTKRTVPSKDHFVQSSRSVQASPFDSRQNRSPKHVSRRIASPHSRVSTTLANRFVSHNGGADRNIQTVDVPRHWQSNGFHPFRRPAVCQSVGFAAQHDCDLAAQIRFEQWT